MKSKVSYKVAMAGILALAAEGGFTLLKDPDHSVRESNRLKLTDGQLAQLETMTPKEKKKFLKELRNA